VYKRQGRSVNRFQVQIDPIALMPGSALN